MYIFKNKPLKVGWIIMNILNESRFLHRIKNFDSIGICRYNWVASHVNSNPEYGLRYELYRPWKRFDALLFLKSMGPESIRLLQKYRNRGCPSIFDANVNYYEIYGNEYYSSMLPTEQQRQNAIEITKDADGVIADSSFLADICSQFNNRVSWIPDNIRMDLVPSYVRWNPNAQKLSLLWSGMATKLFELLSIEKVLLKYAPRIELVLITNSLTALDRWYPGYKERFESMLNKVQHRIIPYQSIEHLLKIYSQGGVVISPRFMDNSYNLGHTEWKITLAMACGRIVLCSPVQSYINVYNRAKGMGIRVCSTTKDWEKAFEAILSQGLDWEAEETAARTVVEKYYSTTVVAQEHAKFLKEIITVQ